MIYSAGGPFERQDGGCHLVQCARRDSLCRNQVSDAEYTILKLEEKLEKERHGNAREDDTANSLEEVGNDFVHRPSSV
jgi:hypothetical protein